MSDMGNKPNVCERSEYKVDDSYIDEAERVMHEGIKVTESREKLTTTQIRNVLAMFADIYNDVLGMNTDDDKLNKSICDKIVQLRIRMVYECGRTPTVKEFDRCTNIVENIKNIKDSRSQFIKVFHYMEALVAYHRFYGGKD